MTNPADPKDEPTDAEVNAAIDALRDKALRGVYGTTGHAWGERSAIKRSAELLKRALAGASHDDFR